MLVCDMLACHMSIFFIVSISVSQWIRRFSMLMPSELGYFKLASVHRDTRFRLTVSRWIEKSHELIPPELACLDRRVTIEVSSSN